MLWKNVSVPHGLVNGAISTSRYIIYRGEAKPPQLPSCVLLDFVAYHQPTVNGGLVPITPVSFTLDDYGSCATSMLNIPLSLAWAMTIHKCQETTLSRAHVCLGAKERQLGIRYVAMSRVRRLEDLWVSYAPLQCFTKISEQSDIARRMNFVRRLESLA